jgi:Putative Flp pilus-assembly TadE/G-like
MRNNERGAILVHVATGLVALILFSALALDEGVLWVSRTQAQSVADAGAMAGAISREFDDLNDPPLANGVAYNAALSAAQQNNIWGDTPTTFAISWNRPAGVPTWIQGKFARVDVFRNGENGSTKIPTYFLQLVGRNNQGVKATATAVAAIANATNNCLRPWMIPDKWAGPITSTYTAPPDYYNPPDPTTGLGGTGYQVPADIGDVVTLNPGSPAGTISPSIYYQVDLNGTGGATLRQDIESCSGVSTAIGDQLTVFPGGSVGPVRQGVNDLVGQDQYATWDASTKQVINSCCPISPRIVPIAMFSPADFAAQNRQSGRFNLTVVNIMGFFVQGADGGGNITGVLVSTAGEINKNGPQVGPGAAFLQKVVLVR